MMRVSSKIIKKFYNDNLYGKKFIVAKNPQYKYIFGKFTDIENIEIYIYNKLNQTYTVSISDIVKSLRNSIWKMID